MNLNAQTTFSFHLSITYTKHVKLKNQLNICYKRRKNEE